MKTIAFLFFLFAVNLIAPAQNNDALKKLKTFAIYANRFNTLFPQEKVYLHLDNTGYFMGETIWFKAYAIRTDSSAYTNLSKVLYVELLTPRGEAIETIKLAIINGQAHGEIKLNKILESGFYEIRAYTRYMSNWDKQGVFSRVIPIFNAPEQDSDYSKMRIDTKSYFSRLVGYREEDSIKVEKLNVRFFPEGGDLVKHLPSRVAFEVTDESGAQLDKAGFLVRENGDTLTSVKTLREGRGIFVCTPSDEKLQLLLPDKKGKQVAFDLPTAKASGCVLSLNLTDRTHISAQVYAGDALDKEVLGFTLMHNGNVLAFDTLMLSASAPGIRKFRREELPAGVSQMTLFDRQGRIYAQRVFFLASDTLKDMHPVRISTPQEYLLPYHKVTLNVASVPGETFSVSVLDAETTTNSCSENAATWLLLSSELKGFIRNPDYYLEKDDTERRVAADLLTLVQGWTRYDWKVMSGIETFQIKQPLEDRLYLDGTLKQAKKKYDVKNVHLTATLYNRKGESLKGYAVTDTLGRYAFELPDCNGEWTLLLNTRKGDKAQKYYVGINRHFSPEKRRLSFYESKLLPAEAPTIELKEVDVPDSLIADMIKGMRVLPTITVTVKKKKKRWTDNARAAWESESNGAKMASLYYNCDQAADEIEDRGEDIPTIFQWLVGEKKIYDIIDSTRGKERPSVYITDNTYITGFGGNGVTNNSVMGAMYGINPKVNESVYLDQVKSVYISLKENDTRWVRYAGGAGATLYIKNPFIVWIYTHHTFLPRIKGLRRTFFQGYNEPAIFPMNDYGVLPPEKDYRRTLYWAPNVTTDDKGQANLEFWNNSTCKQIIVSAEGIARDGKPIVYK